MPVLDDDIPETKIITHDLSTQNDFAEMGVVIRSILPLLRADDDEFNMSLVVKLMAVVMWKQLGGRNCNEGLIEPAIRQVNEVLRLYLHNPVEGFGHIFTTGVN